MAEVVEVVGYPVKVVEVPNVVGPPGPAAVLTPELISDITEDVLDEINDGPDLALLYANAKA